MSYLPICPVLAFENSIKDLAICPVFGAAQPPENSPICPTFRDREGPEGPGGRLGRRVGVLEAREARRFFWVPFGTIDLAICPMHLYVLLFRKNNMIHLYVPGHIGEQVL